MWMDGWRVGRRNERWLVGGEIGREGWGTNGLGDVINHYCAIGVAVVHWCQGLWEPPSISIAVVVVKVRRTLYRS